MADLAETADADRVVIELRPGQPIELGDLSESFAALARLYGRHYRQDGDQAPKLYITKLETGSILMEVAPLVPFFGQAMAAMDYSIIVADFTNRIWRGIKAFSSTPDDLPRIEAPSLDDARDIREFTKPLLGKRGASLGIKHAKYERHEGDKRIVVEYDLDEGELNRAAFNIGQALLPPPSLLENVLASDSQEQIRREVMLFMQQANREPGKEAGRTGDKGVIPEVSDKALPVYFRKSFHDLKHQMTKEANALTDAFVVDVHVQYVNGEAKGYIVTDVHQTISDKEPE